VSYPFDLVVLDLDGTLLSSNKDITEENLKVIRQLLDMGLWVTISTGRAYSSAKQYFNHLSFEIPIILQNGALIYVPGTGKVIRKIALNGKLAKSIVYEIRKRGNRYFVFTDFFKEPDMFTSIEPYGTPFDPYVRMNERRIARVKNVEEYIGEEVAEVQITCSKEEVKEIIERIYNYSQAFSPIISSEIDGMTFLEIFGPNCSKSNALGYLQRNLNIPMERIMFIGDNYNDMDIMDTVGLSVSMKNAPEEVKRHADFVTLSNDEDGVAYAIKKIFKI